MVFKYIKSTNTNKELPIFKVTMLGDSGVGKTVFMSSLYTKMRENLHGISLIAVDDKNDLELSQIMENLYLNSHWPPGTESEEIKYEFYLTLKGEPILRIDWIDYRGGALMEKEDSEGGRNLVQRIAESHSIFCMIDMTNLIPNTYDSLFARIKSRVSRMAALCNNAAVLNNKVSSIIFIRTKSDTVRDEFDNPDWDRACEELVTHLGAFNKLKNIPYSAVIPVSAVGRVSSAKELIGDDPTNVEWALILAVAFMFKNELKNLEKLKESIENEMVASRSGEVFKFLREIFGFKSIDENERMKLADVTHQLLLFQEIIQQLTSKAPANIKIFNS